MTRRVMVAGVRCINDRYYFFEGVPQCYFLKRSLCGFLGWALEEKSKLNMYLSTRLEF